ncbi:hypothetical protein AVEN_209732-1 [Araneus ventricosus]|uniref:Uncharacterized protein n=1 Tax=Araneus ventricosus TaxID=182803 RepID=A0A4Y2CDI4_ARAVE|nr:hypothetical protein AVEN_209732-1 [Araneus ventricosus]
MNENLNDELSRRPLAIEVLKMDKIFCQGIYFYINATTSVALWQSFGFGTEGRGFQTRFQRRFAVYTGLVHAKWFPDGVYGKFGESPYESFSPFDHDSNYEDHPKIDLCSSKTGS